MKAIRLHSVLLLTIISLLFGKTVNAIDHVIYVDISSETSDINATQEKIRDIVDKLQGDNFLFYLSNGSEPFVCKKISCIKESFDDLLYMPKTSIPNTYNDVDSLNHLLANHNVPHNHHKEQNRLKEKVKFHFFLNPKQANMYNQIQEIVNKLLLSNRLFQRGEIVEDANVAIYFDCSKLESKKCENYTQKIKQKFSQYEIQSY